MIEDEMNISTDSKMSLGHYLLNPFRTLAGGTALLLGFIIILLTAFVGALGNTHFDGVIDVHSGQAAPLWFFFAESIIDWLSIVLFLTVSAFIFSPTRWRFIDLLGTQALARWPAIFAALVFLPDANRRVNDFIIAKLTQSSTQLTIHPMDGVIFAFASIVTVVVIIWMVVLMYKAYAVSCNVKGVKAIASFIVSILVAEALSKVLIILMFKSAL